jgi:hypothetical protein
MKTQSEFIRIGEGIAYYEQYFETQTLEKISLSDWKLIQDLVDDLAQILSEGNKVDIDVKILDK